MRQRRPRADSSAGRSSPSTRGGAELIPSRAAGSGSQAWRARSSWWGERGGCWEGLFKSCLRGFWIAGMRALCCTPIKRYHHADARVLAGHSWKPRPHRSPGAEAPPPCLRSRPFPRATKGGSPAHRRAPQRRCAALRFRSRCHGSAGVVQTCSATSAALPPHSPAAAARRSSRAAPAEPGECGRHGPSVSRRPLGLHLLPSSRRGLRASGGRSADGGRVSALRMRIVDDDVGWSSIAAVPEKEEEEDEGDMPVVSARERPGRWWGGRGGAFCARGGYVWVGLQTARAGAGPAWCLLEPYNGRAGRGEAEGEEQL